MRDREQLSIRVSTSHKWFGDGCWLSMVVQIGEAVGIGKLLCVC